MKDTLKLADFGKTLALVFFFLSLCWQGKEPDFLALAFRLLAFLFAALAFLYPSSLDEFYQLWMKLGEFLGHYVSLVLLFIIYFIFITPYSLLIKLFKNDLLDKAIDSKCDSYWLDFSPKKVSKNDFEKQF
ncbi:hypothetical protein GYA49_03190 [Candidatus Beckwithbacteria bacterium]|nr:hypothetical protein [Candidatus Beckwithbacteria bacterium]